MNDPAPSFLAVVSGETPAEEIRALGREFAVLPLPPDPDLPLPVACHPDMIFAEAAGALFFSRRYGETYPALVAELSRLSGMPAVFSDAPRSPEYPRDVGCDALVWRRREGPPILAGLLDALFPELLARAREAGFLCVHVRQGYAACSCIALPDALFTSDDGIAKALSRVAENVYSVPKEGILLPGYGEGFLGGASGVLSEPDRLRVFFSGDPASMEYAETLSRLLDRHRADPVLLSDSPLCDRGGIRFFKIVST